MLDCRAPSGATFRAERHPNSHQRSIALSGQAVFELLRNGEWQKVQLASHTDGLSIPANTWHRITVGPRTLVSLSFQTVPPSELIEETPVGDDLSNTRWRYYLSPAGSELIY